MKTRVGPTPTLSFASIDALALAGGLVEDPTEYWILNVRAPADCVAARIPGAFCLPADDPDARFVAGLPASRTLVVVGGAVPDALPVAVAHWPGRVARLEGGYDAFRGDIPTAPTLPIAPTAAQIADYHVRAALNGLFTGTAVRRRRWHRCPVAQTRPRRRAGGC